MTAPETMSRPSRQPERPRPLRRHPAPKRPARQSRAIAMVASVLENPSPIVKQAPIAALFAVALLLCGTNAFVIVSDLGALLASAAIVGLATVLAVALTRHPSAARLGIVVAAADFPAIAALRHATGDARSIFGALVLVPALWMASTIGRRYIVYTIIGVATVYAFPLLAPGALGDDPNSLIRGIYIVLAYTIAAIVINELALQARRQFEDARAHERAYHFEIEQGAAVQQALLPKEGSPVAGFEVAGACIPATLVGGDFYDWYPTADGLGFTLGDVMGKGVAAGIIAATARAVVRSAKDDQDPVTALRRTDTCLSGELGDVGSFATMFHARLHADTGRVTYADAGHGLTLLIRADGAWERLPSSGLPLGVGLPGGWASGEVHLGEGDLLVSFSDGVLDFYDGTLTALDHLALIACGARTADGIVSAVTELTRQDVRDDDTTVVVLRRLEAPVTSA